MKSLRQQGESDESWNARAISIAESMSDLALKKFQQDIIEKDEVTLSAVSQMMAAIPPYVEDEKIDENYEESSKHAETVIKRFYDFEKRLNEGDPEAVIELAEAYEAFKIVDSLPQDPFDM